MATPAEIFDNYWLFFVLSFVGIEVAALYINNKRNPVKNQGATLTELVRRLMTESRFFKATFIIFWVYLGLHFLEVSIGNFTF